MGAESFYCEFQGETLQEAFDNAVKDAYYWHGHAGYTGTICEKDQVVAFRNIPNPTSDEAHKFYAALDMSWQETSELLVEKFGEEVATEMCNAYNDKWGPAVAFYLGDNNWFFCGMASS